MPSSASFILPPERRNYPRLSKLQRILFVPDDAAVELPYRGVLLDASAGGLRLAVPREVIAEGTVLRVRSPFGKGWVEVLVKNRRQQEHLCEMGCAFLRAPSWEGMSVFG